MRNMLIWFAITFLFAAFISGAFKTRDADDIPMPPARVSVDKTEQ